MPETPDKIKGLLTMTRAYYEIMPKSEIFSLRIIQNVDDGGGGIFVRSLQQSKLNLLTVFGPKVGLLFQD